MWPRRTSMDNLRVYPLARKDNPPKMEFISGSGKAFNTIHANDYTFYEHLNEVIQKEPLDMLDPETRGLFASIGMEKGKPFAARRPDEEDPHRCGRHRQRRGPLDRLVPACRRNDEGHRGLSRPEQRLDDGVGGQERVLQWPGRQDHELRRPGHVPLSLHRGHAGDGGQPCPGSGRTTALPTWIRTSSPSTVPRPTGCDSRRIRPPRTSGR